MSISKNGPNRDTGKVLVDRRNVRVYDAEKYTKTGRGNISFKIDVTGKSETEIRVMLKKIRQDQHDKNVAFQVMRKTEARATDIERSSSMSLGTDLKTLDPPPDTKIVYSKPYLKLDKGTGNSLAMLASSKSGKTTMLMHLYKKYYKKEYLSILFSVNSHISLYKDASLIKYPDGLDSDGQKLVKLAKYINSKTSNFYSILTIFDDLLTLTAGLFDSLFMTMRNSKISTIVCLQYTMLLTKKNRANVNSLLLGSFMTCESVQDVIRIYLVDWFKKEGYTDMTSMIMRYKQITRDHGFIYVHPSSGTVVPMRLHKK